MLELNPHHLLDAWWQHLLMLVVSVILGYLIGYRQRLRSINQIEDQLARLGVALEKCRKSLVVVQPEIIAANLIKKDDLKRIEGIGPKIEQLLHDAGIHSFTQLSSTSVETIKEILDKAGAGFQYHHPTTWPQQAKLAAEGRWDELEKWQQTLDGGV